MGDVADRARVEAVLREHKIEAVMHFAAFALVGESVHEPDLYYQNNVVGSLSLLEAMRAAGVTRIVFSSTTATYGVPERMPITEDTPQQPDQSVRVQQAGDRAGVGRLRPRLWLCLCGPAVFQRRGREPGRRSGRGRSFADRA